MEQGVQYRTDIQREGARESFNCEETMIKDPILRYSNLARQGCGLRGWNDSGFGVLRTLGMASTLWK